MLLISIESIMTVIIFMTLLIMASVILVFVTRYKKCPSDKIMVIYGKIAPDKDGTYHSARCIHGGAAFIVPILQNYDFLDLTPLSINVEVKNAVSRDNIHVDVPSRFTVGISTEPGIMQNAAERLLGLKLAEIQEMATDIIFGQMRLVIAIMSFEEIDSGRDKFLDLLSNNVEREINKIGLRLININMIGVSIA